MTHIAPSPALPVRPSETEALMAGETRQKITRRLLAGAKLQLQVEDNSGAEAEPLPEIATRLVLDMLDELARGNAVTLTALQAELTTQQAAELLNVSRPTLIGLLDEGKIPYRRLGTHRRIPLDDVLAFKADLLAKRMATLDELVAHDQALGLE